MLRFGIFDAGDYRPPPRGAPRIVRMLYTSRRVSLQLLRTSLPASPAELRVFQYLVNFVRVSGVYRTTFPGRFKDLDPAVNELLAERHAPDAALDVHDWAASDCLTSFEWAASLFTLFPRASVTASDLMLSLVEATLPNGSVFILEPDGHAVQYVRRPFVVRLDPPDPALMVVNRLIGWRAQRRIAARPLRIPPEWLDSDSEELVTGEATLRKLPLTHPQARLLAANEPRFSIRRHSAFEPIERSADVIRTMNIFNRAYFAPERLRGGANAVWKSLKPGGTWIVGRTTEREGRNDATVFERGESGFRVLARLGNGSEIEELVAGFTL
ncbi:MAG TPA: hypothetical protein VI670_23200 [Thermoanaerobaculia bacterium]|jgi:hypothetical protein